MTTPTTGSTPQEVRRRNVEAILPLLPNQQALLLLRDMNPDDDPGFLQVRFSLDGPLDVDRWRQAWGDAVARHQSLRMSVHPRPEGGPMAVIWRSVEVPWTYSDWSGRNAGEREQLMGRLLTSDRARGLDFADAPVMRLTVIRTGTDVHEIVWTCHHLFTGGWSAALVLEDVMALYRGAEIPPAADLRDYVAWANDREEDSTERYWRGRLAGYPGAPRLDLGAARPDATGHGGRSEALDGTLVNGIEALAGDLHVTSNAIFQAAWSLVLSKLFNTTDVVFGTTVAGRSAPVPGMERLVGYFSNAVPIRAHLDLDQTVSEWLHLLRNEQFEMQPFEHASLADVLGWSDVPGHRPLFETFLVFENFPTYTPEEGAGDGLVMSEFRSGVTAAFPLTLAVTLGNPWQVHVRFEQARCAADAVDRILRELIAMLTAVVEGRGRTVGSLRSPEDDLAALLASSTPRTEMPVSVPAALRPPTTDVERRLAVIWEELLDLPHIGIDDDYFALGGSSLGAVRLFGRIEKEFGVGLPLHTLVQHATIAGLAHVLTGDGHPSIGAQCLVPFQTGGGEPPIVCVHGGGGDVLFYRELAKRLGEAQPVYGLEPVGLDGREAPLETVPGMAARYIEDLRSVHPDGPFRLVGFCFGGAVALEMSHQLEAMGQQVELLAVIDAGLPLDAARATTTWARAAAVLRTRGPYGALQAAVRRLENRGQLWWDGSFAGAEGRNRANRGQVAQACDRAFRGWDPRASSAPITLIRSTRYRAGAGGDFHFGWDAYAPGVDTVTIDTDHDSLFEEPAIDDLARAIRARLPGER